MPANLFGDGGDVLLEETIKLALKLEKHLVQLRQEALKVINKILNCIHVASPCLSFDVAREPKDYMLEGR